MKEHPNFYENINEANMRLGGTVVLYDKQPYHVLAVTGHMKDGIFRMYLDPLPFGPMKTRVKRPSREYLVPDSGTNPGEIMDKWLEQYPGEGVLRKHINSPLFDKFRPFPLGMANAEGSAFHIERQPNRKTEQGLIPSMLQETQIKCGGGKATSGRYGAVSLYEQPFSAMVMGEYPTAHETLAALNDPSIENESVGFNRSFALARGPIDMLFLAYKSDVIGVLPRNDFSLIKIGDRFKYTKEVVEELKLFTDIQ